MGELKEFLFERAKKHLHLKKATLIRYLALFITELITEL